LSTLSTTFVLNLTLPLLQMFTGNEPTDRDKYKRMDKDAQLQPV
jgi:hypothetical protein